MIRIKFIHYLNNFAKLKIPIVVENHLFGSYKILEPYACPTWAVLSREIGPWAIEPKAEKIKDPPRSDGPETTFHKNSYEGPIYKFFSSGWIPILNNICIKHVLIVFYTTRRCNHLIYLQNYISCCGLSVEEFYWISQSISCVGWTTCSCSK